MIAVSTGETNYVLIAATAMLILTAAGIVIYKKTRKK